MFVRLPRFDSWSQGTQLAYTSCITGDPGGRLPDPDDNPRLASRCGVGKLGPSHLTHNQDIVGSNPTSATRRWAAGLGLPPFLRDTRDRSHVRRFNLKLDSMVGRGCSVILTEPKRDEWPRAPDDVPRSPCYHD